MSENVRVAIVDDNPIMQQIMVKALHKYMHVRVAPEDVFTDGLSLLKALAMWRYDLILLDIEMPIMDGLQATLRIRNPVEDPANASVWTNLRNSVLNSSGRSSECSRSTRPATPSPTVRQMRYALTSVGSGTAPEINNDVAFRILEENRTVPIVAITANAFLDEQRRHCMSVGMNDVVSKPITPEAIKDIMRRYLDSDHFHMRLSVDDLAELVEPREQERCPRRDRNGQANERSNGSEHTVEDRPIAFHASLPRNVGKKLPPLMRTAMSTQNVLGHRAPSTESTTHISSLHSDSEGRFRSQNIAGRSYDSDDSTADRLSSQSLSTRSTTTSLYLDPDGSLSRPQEKIAQNVSNPSLRRHASESIKSTLYGDPEGRFRPSPAAKHRSDETTEPIRRPSPPAEAHPSADVGRLGCGVASGGGSIRRASSVSRKSQVGRPVVPDRDVNAVQ
ncbi:uncharacterized protein SPPG_00279 [Spizellomyces punctatus DAOM BR117]|uniref:Response regulatory domain-containing protein n=1 Tax=Spizellomyces punctatus (strain DAOM BR117) TaxID=645134 RepID=A0A0L0HUI5_SPIPD|nr:uncharacterized protein SPPG_00279 [Spizellomyces punctatus DAOM BR117]KND04555.1 hypothetical protein SPPG_00279 [Spizellomyces punctatus DAOM BR117]|eukprot:XP_016612594.1 hypothetical protein SPPG_00279 [Spizellomyces punctatus DAOM BR117]